MLYIVAGQVAMHWEEGWLFLFISHDSHHHYNHFARKEEGSQSLIIIVIITLQGVVHCCRTGGRRGLHLSISRPTVAMPAPFPRLPLPGLQIRIFWGQSFALEIFCAFLFLYLFSLVRESNIWEILRWHLSQNQYTHIHFPPLPSTPSGRRINCEESRQDDKGWLSTFP